MQYRIQRNNDSLKHHGILGMHWGVRRYQNEDGSYTDAGRKHYGIGDVKRRIKAATGFYKPDDGNPYVSTRRKKNRQAEIDWAEKRKQKEKKRSEAINSLKAVEKESRANSKKLKEDAKAFDSLAKLSKSDARKLKKTYALGRAVAGALVGGAVGGATFYYTQRKLASVDPETAAKRALKAMAGYGVYSAISSHRKAYKEHKEAEERLGVR